MASPNENEKPRDNRESLPRPVSEGVPGCGYHGPDLSGRQYRIVGFVVLLIGVMLAAKHVAKDRAALTPSTAPGFTSLAPTMTADGRAGPNMMDMMKQMGMKPEMMARMQLLMRTGVFVDSPAALQVQKDRLQLSAEQAGQLSQIEREARQKALALLTPEQRTALGGIPDAPLVMMEMCQEMMVKMPAGAEGQR